MYKSMYQKNKIFEIAETLAITNFLVLLLVF